MTGTLIVNGKDDLQNLATMYQKGPNDLQFDRKRVKKGDHDQKIKELMNCNVSYLTSDDVKANMPTWTETAVLFEMSPTYYNEYMKIEVIAEEKGVASSGPGPFQTYLRSATAKLEGDMNPKIIFVKNLLEAPKNKQKQIIISSEWVEKGVDVLLEVLKTINLNRLPKDKIKYGYIDGDMSKEDRKIAQSNYNTKTIQVIILSKAGNTGLNFLATDILIKLDVGYHDAGRRQSMFRAIWVNSHKDSENKHVQVYSLYIVKPDEFEEVVTEFENDAQKGAYGAPSEVETFRSKSSGTADLESKTDIPAIDIALYRLQKQKAEITYETAEKIIKPASIENEENNC